jgi:hypothetical protein
MAASSVPRKIQPQTQRDASSPAPQLITAFNLNDGTNWHVFATAARLLPPTERSAFAFRVLGRLLDSPATRTEVLMACCDAALVETAVASDKWTVRP